MQNCCADFLERKLTSHLTKSGRLVAIAVGGSLLCAASLARAQQAPGLDLHLYAGLTITGAVETVYSVEAVSDLASSNNAAAWRCLDYVKLPTTPYVWMDKSGPAQGTRFYRATPFMPTNLVYIPAGTFRIGNSTNELGWRDTDMPPTELTLTRSFWMGKYETTQGEFLSLMGTNPAIFKINANYPVENVTWFDATNYCNRLTEQERAAGHILPNCTYRLPTEAEWEYACRAWTSTRFSCGDDPSYTIITNYAWVAETLRGLTYLVGEKLPNPWGLYDMHGNVWEWCQDWWTEKLPGGTAIDPQGPATGTLRVVRGGDFHFSAVEARSSSRYYDSPDLKFSNIGFRVVLVRDDP